MCLTLFNLHFLSLNEVGFFVCLLILWMQDYLSFLLSVLVGNEVYYLYGLASLRFSRNIVYQLVLHVLLGSRGHQGEQVYHVEVA